MSNGWLHIEMNAEAVGSLALGARRFAARMASLHGVAPADRKQADADREVVISRHPGADRTALSLSCAISLADMLATGRAPWRERLPKEPRWFANATLEALSGLREALSWTDTAEVFGADAQACRSGLLAFDMPEPDSLYSAVALLDSWTGDALARLARDITTKGSTLAEAVAEAGGAPCAVYRDDHAGFPVVVMSLDDATGEGTGFPTAGFIATDFWAKRPSWLQQGAIPGALDTAWTGAPAKPEVIEAAISDFESRALPEIRQAYAKGMFMGTKRMAETLGVSVSRLAGWMRQEGHMVRGGEGWVPAPNLGRDTVRPKRDKLGHVSYVWSPEFLRDLAPHAAEIAGTVLVRGPAKPPQPPSEKQASFLRKLSVELGIELPDGCERSKAAASAAIESMMAMKSAARVERQPGR